MLNDIIRYKTLIQNLNDAILVEDENRTISLTNQSFCDLFEILAPVDALIGADCSQSAEQSKAFFKDPEEFVKNVCKILKAQAPVYGEYIEMVNGKPLSLAQLASLS